MKKRQVNWDKVYRALLPVLDSSMSTAAVLNLTPDQILSELRTLSIGGGRCTGKTTWMIKEMIETDDSIMICKDAPLRMACCVMYKELYGAGGMLKSRRKFYTANDLESMDQAVLAKVLKKTKRVFIDEPRYNHKLGMVYKYLAQHMDVENAIIVQMGT